MADMEMKNEEYWDELERKSNILDFKAIGKLLCGEKLSDDEQAVVDEFGALHDEVRALKVSGMGK